MWTRLTSLPFFVLLMGISGIAMILPSFHALMNAEYEISRHFFYTCLLLVLLAALLGVATYERRPRVVARSHLVTLLAAYLVLPILLAIPFYESHGRTTFFNAWFEMVSDFTTTGSTLYDSYWSLDASLHLWRAVVGWLGGLFMWITAIAVLQPLNLGGYEVRNAVTPQSETRSFAQITRVANTSERLSRFTLQLAPIYFGLTFVLWVILLILGEDTLTALCHAMSTLSTSGISPNGGLYWSESGYAGEVAIFAFMIFAISRQTFARDTLSTGRAKLTQDPEIRLAFALIVSVSLLLYLRHFMGSYEDNRAEGFLSGLQAIWGGIFMTMSFLTTTGFESRGWTVLSDWSELSTPGLFLVGLALTGGGIATTAGGVKLLRIYSLFRHSEREIEKLVHPSSVGGSGQEARRIRRNGAQISWIFFMLFALSIIGVMVALSFTGVQFENAMILAVAALSNTGPLVEIAAEAPISVSGVTQPGKIILAFAMVLGRLEALAIIALINPEFWRN